MKAEKCRNAKNAENLEYWQAPTATSGKRELS